MTTLRKLARVCDDPIEAEHLLFLAQEEENYIESQKRRKQHGRPF